MSVTLDAFLQEYPVVIDMPVQWGEMDAFQHVNNVAYFRYFESARITYMGRTSMFADIASQRVYPVLAATECRYKKAVTFPDTLKIGCRVSEIQEYGFLQAYGIYSLAQDAVTTLGSGRIVLLDADTGKQAAVSARLRADIDTIEQRR